jgi:hypothetical protein
MPSWRQFSTTERIAATPGPACWLPMWIQFLRLWKSFHNRKNSLFVGNPRGGRTAAILASLTSTCRRHDIDPQLYLTQLLTNLSQARKSELPNWLPDQWKQLQAEQLRS